MFVPTVKLEEIFKSTVDGAVYTDMMTTCDSEITMPELVFNEFDTIDIMDSTTLPFLTAPLQLVDEDTVEAIDNKAYVCPATGPPERTLLPGLFNFQVEINSKDTCKKKYLYSHQLNRVYVDMNSDFAVQFWWQGAPERMYVRATVVFTDQDQAEKRVERCMQHRHENDLPENIRMNVLRSSRAMGTEGVYYQGDASRPDSWYSVLVEFTNNSQPVIHAYKFVCKNSCCTGINRRPISIIYTLEDVQGTVYGRQMVSVRVCSCPRRDLHKDEESEGVFVSGKKRVASNRLQPKAKKVKLEVVASASPDAGVHALPQLQVIGLRPMIAGLEVMVRMMEQGLEMRREDSQYVANTTASIESLKASIESYKNSLPK